MLFRSRFNEQLDESQRMLFRIGVHLGEVIVDDEDQNIFGDGVNIALGTDGAASNNRLSMLGELQIASLIGKTRHEDPKAVSAWTSLEMATLNGAKALGCEDQLGSIEVGKAADLIAIDVSGVQHSPRHDLASTLVYSTNGGEVCWSWVAGQALVRDGKLQTLDTTDLAHRATRWSEQLDTFRETLEP